MQPLNPEFLKLIARKYDLTSEQQEVFVPLFSTNRTQQEVAEELNIEPTTLRTRMTGVYTKFRFTDRKPNKARRLHDWLLKQERIYIPESEQQNAIKHPSIEQLVTDVRQAIETDVRERCGKMQVLDMTQPISLDDIYTDVNVLEKITARQRLGLEQLQETCNFDLEKLERIGLGNIVEERIAGIEAVEKHSKLMIWGKPGAGKTTFLKYLAVKCNLKQFKSNLIPIFITLRSFAEDKSEYSLGMYIAKYIAQFNIPEHQTEKLLRAGKLLIFLDGLDEVKRENKARVITQIQNTGDRYSQNQFIVTCRIAAKEYTFQGFTEVEIADFNLEQITAFVNNWFCNKDPVKAEKFLAKLKNNKPIQELATNPLLLTLLCLVFGEKLDFTANRSELYKEGIDILLRNWDAGRNIERDEVYRRLTRERKKDLLSKIAFISFKNSTYFFKQEIVEGYIADYIQNLPYARTDESALLLDSQMVLKSIVAQHGLLVPRAKNIYSFSHLTFHEYFTARQIIEVDKSDELVLENFVEHIFDKSWQEVFLLSVQMSSKADFLVVSMKRKIDNLIACDFRLQKYLAWLNQETLRLKSPLASESMKNIRYASDFIINDNYTLSRTFNLFRTLNLNQNLNRKPKLNLNQNLDPKLKQNVYHDLMRVVDLSRNFHSGIDFDQPLERILRFFDQENSQLHQRISNLKAQLPDPNNKAKLQSWWLSNGFEWSEELRNIIIKYRNIGHDWEFNNRRQKLLTQYYQANRLLIECLAQECYISRPVRRYIEETLLLPMSEIEKYPDPLAK